MFTRITTEKIAKWEQRRKIRKLLKSAANKDEGIKIAANNALCNISASCLKYLRDTHISGYKKNVVNNRAEAARTLGKIKDRSAVEPLISDWYESRGKDRVAVVWALGELGDERAIEKVTKSLHHATWGADRSFSLSSTAIGALRRIGTPKALDAIRFYENMVRRERDDSREGILFTCPYCKKTISRYAIDCPKCRGTLKRGTGS